MPFDKEEFFKKQIEECRELESQAVSAEDRAHFGGKLLGAGKSNFAKRNEASFTTGEGDRAPSKAEHDAADGHGQR